MREENTKEIIVRSICYNVRVACIKEKREKEKSDERAVSVLVPKTLWRTQIHEESSQIYTHSRGLSRQNRTAASVARLRELLKARIRTTGLQTVNAAV